MTRSMSEEKEENVDDEIRVKCMVFSRIVGYLTPVRDWNEAKQQEFADRVVFKQPALEQRANAATDLG